MIQIGDQVSTQLVTMKMCLRENFPCFFFLKKIVTHSVFFQRHDDAPHSYSSELMNYIVPLDKLLKKTMLRLL